MLFVLGDIRAYSIVVSYISYLCSVIGDVLNRMLSSKFSSYSWQDKHCKFSAYRLTILISFRTLETDFSNDGNVNKTASSLSIFLMNCENSIEMSTI